METLATRTRFCHELQLWTLSRPRKTCSHRSPYCAKNCYFDKFERVYPGSVLPCGEKDERAWQTISPETVESLFQKLERSPRFRSTRRLRLMKSGEALSTLSDFPRVTLLCQGARRHKVKLWLPSRVWRSPTLAPLALQLQSDFPDVLRLLASTDPSDPIAPSQWSTMFFGDNYAIDGRTLCPKTWNHKTCATCRGACFSPTVSRGAVHVHLRQH